MGEMADFALEQVVTMECMRMDFIEGRMDIGEAYEQGIVDEQGGMPKNDYAEKNASVPWNHREELLRAQLDLSAFSQESDCAIITSRQSSVVKSCRKNCTKWKMLKGMAITVNSLRSLSQPQCMWLSTNYGGGSSEFKKDMKCDEKFRLVVNLANAVIKIGNSK